MSRRGAAALAVAVVLALGPGAGAKAAPGTVERGFAGWDGLNPFRCTLQEAGRGTTVADPGADPYCVHFDKTNQNVTELGLIQFLSLEPARTAAALPKCFYFQSDHWRGSVVQSDGSTRLYEFYGHYYFDKARAAGGAWITELTIDGQSADPTQLPGIPSAFARDMGPGTAGGQVTGQIPADPRCAARAAADPSAIYGPTDRPTAPAAAPPAPACVPDGGPVTPQGIGPVRLGFAEERVRAALGAPLEARAGFLRYCQRFGGDYLVGLSPTGSGRVQPSSRTVMILTTGRAYRLRGVGPGSPVARVRRRFPQAVPLLRLAGARVWATGRQSDLLVAVARRRVRWIAVYDRAAASNHAALAALLRRAA